MQLRIHRLVFQGGDVLELDRSHWRIRGGHPAWGLGAWTQLRRMTPIGDRINVPLMMGVMQYGFGRGNQYRVGHSLEIEVPGRTFQTAPLMSSTDETLTIEAPSVDTYRVLLEEYQEAFSRHNLVLAARIQREALALMARPDWVEWSLMFKDGYGRGIPFIRERGRRVAVLHWDDEHRALVEAAIATAGDEWAFDVEEAAKIAGHVAQLRGWLREDGRLSIRELTGRLRAIGGSRPKELANWLRDNREVHFEGSEVHIGADPDLPAQEPTVPPFKVYFASKSDMTPEQLSFYNDTVEPAFRNLTYIDLDGYLSYGFVYLYDVVRAVHSDPDQARRTLAWAIDAYAGTAIEKHATNWLRDSYFVGGDFAAGFKATAASPLDLPEYIALEHSAGLRIRVSDARGWVGTDTGLTHQGQEMGDEVDREMQAVLDEFHDAHGVSIVMDWWQRLAIDRKAGEPAPDVEEELAGVVTQEWVQERIEWADDGAHLYDRSRRAFAGVPGLDSGIPWPEGYPNFYWYNELTRMRLRAAFRVAENRVRERRRMPLIGEGWVSEVALLHLIREAFPDERVVHQARPKWLKPQSLDIYLPDRNIGIEYQGLQHSEPVDRFGGAEAFEAQQVRDARKRELCAHNDCALIEVHPDYVFDDVAAQVQVAILQEARSQGTRGGIELNS